MEPSCVDHTKLSSMLSVLSIAERVDKLPKDSKAIVEILRLTLDEIMCRYTSLLKERYDRINKLETDLVTVKNILNEYENKIDSFESQQFSQDIIVSGISLPPEIDNENCSRIVTTIIRDKLNYNLKVSDVKNSVRMGKKVNNASRRNILVTLDNTSTKRNLIKSCRSTKPYQFFINEKLVSRRNSLLFCLRHARKKFPNLISSCNSIDMKVFVWVKPPNLTARGATDLRIEIDSFTKLNDFCVKTLKTTLSSLVDVTKISAIQ